MANTRASMAGDGGGRSTSSAVLDAIADEEGTGPLAFDTALYDVIDPDALDALVGDEQFDGTVAFDYLEYRVRVHGDGHVELESLDE